MTWARLDDQRWRNRKIRRCSWGAIGLDDVAISYCCDHLTDGVLTIDDLDDIADMHKSSIDEIKPLINELVKVGRWVCVEPDTWRIHDFLQYNKSRSEVERTRKDTAERVANWRDKQRSNKDVTALQEECNAPVTLPPSRPGPVPSRPAPSVSTAHSRRGEHPGFAQFWAAYPRKVGKGRAEKVWHKMRPPLDECLATLEWQVRSDDWTKNGGKFTPHPTTWLNGKQWEDEPSEQRDEWKPQTPIDRAIREYAAQGGFGPGPSALERGNDPEGVRNGSSGYVPDRPSGPGLGSRRPGMHGLAPELEVLPGGRRDPGSGEGACEAEDDGRTGSS